MRPLTLIYVIMAGLTDFNQHVDASQTSQKPSEGFRFRRIFTPGLASTISELPHNDLATEEINEEHPL